MRTLVALFTASACLLALAARNEPAGLKLTLVDAETGDTIPGVVRLLDGDGHPVAIPGTLSRGEGLDEGSVLREWNVVPGPVRVELPRGIYQVEAFSGLETELSRVEVGLKDGRSESVSVPLTRFSKMRDKGWRSANTHLHLMKLDRETADRYLTEVPAADDLDVLFISYLERINDDKDYISNRYCIGDLKQFSRGRVLVNSGEEHRHNMEGDGEGYGHVMLLDIRELVKPVSIGPGIMKSGHDGIPVQPGIQNAHDQGGKAIWCHNDWGLEDIPNWITGRLDAQNIFDGGHHGSFKDSFYRYLNVGLKVPFSTGTDWFMYDLSRAYVAANGRLTPRSWLEALAAGRSFVTNGPILELNVEGQGIGDTLELSTGRGVRVEGVAQGRGDFGRVELVQNGKVVLTSSSEKVGGHYEARLDGMVEIHEPGWLALRTPPPPSPDDKAGQESHPRNEFDRPLFGHTSPIYVTVAGRSIFDRNEAERLLADMRSAKETISQQGQFLNEQDKQRVLSVYDEGIATLRRRMADSR